MNPVDTETYLNVIDVDGNNVRVPFNKTLDALLTYGGVAPVMKACATHSEGRSAHWAFAGSEILSARWLMVRNQFAQLAVHAERLGL
jgi:hypothetical protein